MNNFFNHQINTSILNQGLYQAVHENQANIISSFSELQPITNLSEYSACLYRAETSITADLRIPRSTSGEVQWSGAHNSTALTQGYLEQNKPKQKLVPVPPEYRRHNEDEHTRICRNVLLKRKHDREIIPVPPEYRLPHEDEHTRIRRNVLIKRKRDRVIVPVPPEYRLPHEDEHTRIRRNVLLKRKRDRESVPVPPEHRFYNEDEDTRISPNALSLRKCNRKRVPVPPEYRLRKEDEHTLISYGVLENRKRLKKLVPVPPEHRLYNEDEHTLISFNTLRKRKQRKLKSTAFSGEKPHVSHQAGETSAANTSTGNNRARQNSPILTRSPSSSNTLPLHETTSQGTKETDETLPPFESETAFSHWLDDLNVQQSAIDYIQNCHW
ncbi:MAG: hypothetical protein P8144_06435 [Gammaproteobacteria bacterium]